MFLNLLMFLIPYVIEVTEHPLPQIFVKEERVQCQAADQRRHLLTLQCHARPSP